MFYCVYIHTNKINNKKYIGITSQTPSRRWRNGEGYKGCSYFYNAIKKYGWDNFYHDVVAVGLSKEEACALEQEYIFKMKTNQEEYGYNLLSGGEAGKHSEKTKKKLSEMFAGKVVSDETKKKMKEAAKKEVDILSQNNLVKKCLDQCWGMKYPKPLAVSFEMQLLLLLYALKQEKFFDLWMLRQKILVWQNVQLVLLFTVETKLLVDTIGN